MAYAAGADDYWEFEQVEDGAFCIKEAGVNNYLSMEYDATNQSYSFQMQAGTCGANEKWQISAKLINEGTYYIKNIGKNQYLANVAENTLGTADVTYWNILDTHADYNF